MKQKSKISNPAVLAAIAGAAAIILGCPFKANANLGDTYAQSIRGFGCQPKTTTGTVIWWLPNPEKSWVGEIFYHNQCVAVFYGFTNGNRLADSEVWRLMAANAKPGTTWQQYNQDSQGTYYVNSEQNLFADLMPNGTLKIAYKSYLDRHNQWHDSGPNSTEQPPVQDGDNAPSNNPAPSTPFINPNEKGNV